MARKVVKWIQKAIKHPGALRAYMKRKYGEKAFTRKGTIKREYLLRALKETKSPTIKRRIYLALTLRKLAKRR